MKADKPIRVVLVDGDSTHLIRTHSRAFDTFTTVRFDDRKRAAETKYGVFWSLISRRMF